MPDTPPPGTTPALTAPERHVAAWHDLRRRRPRTARLLAALWRRPLAVLLPLAVATTAVSVQDLQPHDLRWFVAGGRVITSPDVWQVFTDEGLQMGPLYLALVGLVVRASDALGVPVMGALGAVLAALLVWSTDAVARRWADLSDLAPVPVRWAVGGALVGGGMLSHVSTSGHQEELLLAVLLAAAAAAATRGRAGRVGLLLALGAGIKVWAVLGGPVVLHRRRWRPAVVAALVACLGAAVTYLPFAVWGEVRTFEFSWGIAEGPSLLAQVGALLGLDDWGLRALQAGAAGLAGLLVALRRHGSALAVVITVIAVRLLLDPIPNVYYAAPLVLLGVLWCWTSPARPGTVARTVAVLAVPLTVLHPYLLPRPASTTVEALLCAGILTGVLWREHVAHRTGATTSPARDDARAGVP